MTDEHYDGEGGEGGEGEPSKEGEFDGVTHLYIRTNPADTGDEPLAAGLQFWTSPDIWIVKPNGGVGGEAVPNQVNQLQVTVTNAGGIPAIDAFVDAFVANPALAITPANATLVGSGYLDIPAYSTAMISLPWTPQPGDTGHRCIVARVSLVAPLDTYTNPAAFEVIQDRHVAQRNIQVVELPQGKTITFPFLLGEIDVESVRVVERTREMRLDDIVALAGRGGGIPSKVPLQGLKVSRARPDERPERLSGREGLGRPDPERPERPERARRANLAQVSFQAHERDEPGSLHVIDVMQVDERGAPAGGLTFVVRVV